jgi:RimJ/RimL family protein N-acetyltransferase
MNRESPPQAPGALGPAPELVGAFVRLRPLRVEDAEATHRWRSSDRARLLDGAAGSVEAQARWIAGRPASEYNWVIELVDSPDEGARAIGMLSLVGIDLVNRRAESARFLIGEEEAARGVPAAVEAMKLLYELAFDALGLHRIHGIIAANNTRMIKWQLFLGMREEGRWRDHYFKNGAFVDCVLLGLLEDEYRRVTAPRMRALMQMGQPAKRSLEP